MNEITGALALVAFSGSAYADGSSSNSKEPASTNSLTIVKLAETILMGIGAIYMIIKIGQFVLPPLLRNPPVLDASDLPKAEKASIPDQTPPSRKGVDINLAEPKDKKNLPLSERVRRSGHSAVDGSAIVGGVSVATAFGTAVPGAGGLAFLAGAAVQQSVATVGKKVVDGAVKSSKEKWNS